MLAHSLRLTLAGCLFFCFATTNAQDGSQEKRKQKSLVLYTSGILSFNENERSSAREWSFLQFNPALRWNSDKGHFGELGLDRTRVRFLKFEDKNANQDSTSTTRNSRFSEASLGVLFTQNIKITSISSSRKWNLFIGGGAAPNLSFSRLKDEGSVAFTQGNVAFGFQFAVTPRIQYAPNERLFFEFSPLYRFASWRWVKTNNSDPRVILQNRSVGRTSFEMFPEEFDFRLSFGVNF